MFVLNDREIDGLRNLAQLKRKRRLRQDFLHEFGGGDIPESQLSAFFDNSFDTIITLPSVRDDELLNLCRIGYKKRQLIENLDEFKRCQKEQKWPGRALFLSAALED